VPARLAIAALTVAAVLAGCAGPKQTTPPAAPQPPPQAAPTPPPEPPGPARLGLLLPFTGDGAAIGNDMLDGAQLALFDFPDVELELLPRDTAADAPTAVAAARAVLDEGARLLIGPLYSQATKEVAPVATARRVAVLSFSNDTTAARPGVYVLGFRPEEQVERVVEYAVRQGLPRVAALVPDDAYGARVLQAWRTATGRTLGAEPAPSAAYPVDGEDVTPVVRRLLDHDRRAAAAGEGGVPADPPFDALLLADAGPRLVNILGLLRFFDLDPARTRLLGTMRWQEDPSLANEPMLQGAWLAVVPPGAAGAFARRFEAVYGRPPGSLAGLAYDATALAAVLVRNRLGLDDAALTAPEGFAGQLGIFRLLPSGLAEHGLAVVAFERGGPRLIEPAPTSFVTGVAAR
jgi:ABC-type branched-subunit amino acid transport system substrate-binding protein